MEISKFDACTMLDALSVKDMECGLEPDSLQLRIRLAEYVGGTYAERIPGYKAALASWFLAEKMYEEEEEKRKSGC
jgi:hypothetical protein